MIGKVRDMRTGCILAINSGCPRVASNKNFSPVIVAFSEIAGIP